MAYEEFFKKICTENASMNPDIPDTVVDYINELFKSKIKKQQLTTAELKTIAKELLEKLERTSKGEDLKNEN